LEEFDRELNVIEGVGGTTEGKVYVLHDSNDKYLIRGRRDNESLPFSFISHDYNLDSLVDFLEIFFGKQELCKLKLYNHNDLPLTSEEITFDYLHENLFDENIITSYYPEIFSKRDMTKALNSIKNVFNYYNAQENNY
jgi:hypothetical protein